MKEGIKEFIERNNNHTIFESLGIRIKKLDADETILDLEIDDRHRQHVGLVHGGVYVLLAESVTSLAAACTLVDESKMIVGVEINANHLRSTQSGIITARSKCLHRGSKILVYEAFIEDVKKRLISVARSTLMAVDAISG